MTWADWLRVAATDQARWLEAFLWWLLGGYVMGVTMWSVRGWVESKRREGRR